ncbi:MAG: winged helix-turn-helix domain-containing protein [Candidatus Aenigmarchaeota archaeon]|nr:winged helix-turn-helix domain-containing protein [Candidatus Aenigmarchaeota archaeon]
MADVLEMFGGKAGLVWQELKRRSPQTVNQLTSKTNLSKDDVFVALGWLAREGKINLDDSNKSPRFGLIE